DLFFMKTCDFREAQPRSIGEQQRKEGLLCELEPCARYGMKPCGQSRCFLCKSERNMIVIQYAEQQLHTFINGYQAILNCPATCETSNIIYALTCPCGDYDYIGSTSKSLFDRISEHREEGHRIIREFLFGPDNVKMMFIQSQRNKEPLANPYDQCLYHHSSRCQSGLQRFLDRNPVYWCFVPQTCGRVSLDNEQFWDAKKKMKDQKNRTSAFTADLTVPMEEHNRSLSISSATGSSKSMFFEAIVVDMKRTQEDAQRLIRDLPGPPKGYDFSLQQRQEQFDFFREKREQRVVPSDYVHLYNYSMVAVLPMHCSRNLRRFIESLFITHAEAKLNLIGRLTHPYPNVSFDSTHRGDWCSGLIHPTMAMNSETF
ncbi:unnamed protein product, partial [Rotaria sp. Silwood2]